MKIPLLGGAHKLRSVNVSGQRTVNLYPVVDPEAKSRVTLFGTPGLVSFGTASGAGRGMLFAGGVLYAVFGATLYSFSSGGAVTSLAGIASASGHVSMAYNGTQLAIADGRLLIYDVATGVLTDTGYNAVSVGFIDQYFVFFDTGTGLFRVTALGDGTTIDSLDVATAEGAPDDIVSLIVDHREVWLFGEETTEVWYDAGGSDFPLARLQGAFIETGCAARSSVAKLDNSVFWVNLDTNGQGHVMRANGYVPQIVSDRGVELALAAGSISDAVAYTYQQEGRSFYVLNLPTIDQTWCYDVSNGMWHQRMYWDGAEHRHRAVSHAFAYGKHLVQDHSNGKVYELSQDAYDDAGHEMLAIRETQTLSADGERMFFGSLQVDIEAGVGLVSGQGSDPQLMLQWSDDGGHTWSNERWVSMGKIGEYGRRAIWRMLGSAFNRTWRLKISDPVKRVLIDGYVNV